MSKIFTATVASLTGAEEFLLGAKNFEAGIGDKPEPFTLFLPEGSLVLDYGTTITSSNDLKQLYSALAAARAGDQGRLIIGDVEIDITPEVQA